MSAFMMMPRKIPIQHKIHSSPHWQTTWFLPYDLVWERLTIVMKSRAMFHASSWIFISNYPPINVSAVLDKNCRAGENRSQISRIWDVPSPASLSPTCFPAHPLPNCLPQEQEWQWGHNAILLICDLFSPALQLLSTTALTLVTTNNTNRSSPIVKSDAQ